MTDRIAQLQALLEQEPDDTFCLYSLAMEYAKAGKAEQALHYFDRTVQIDPDYCYAYFHKARTQEESGDDDAARETLRAGLERARSAGDAKALAEIEAYLDALS